MRVKLYIHAAILCFLNRLGRFTRISACSSTGLPPWIEYMNARQYAANNKIPIYTWTHPRRACCILETENRLSFPSGSLCPEFTSAILFLLGGWARFRRPKCLHPWKFAMIFCYSVWHTVALLCPFPYACPWIHTRARVEGPTNGALVLFTVHTKCIRHKTMWCSIWPDMIAYV